MKGQAVFWTIWGLANGAWLGVLVASDFGTTFSITVHALIVVLSVVMLRYCLRRVP